MSELKLRPPNFTTFLHAAAVQDEENLLRVRLRSGRRCAPTSMSGRSPDIHPDRCKNQTERQRRPPESGRGDGFSSARRRAAPLRRLRQRQEPAYPTVSPQARPQGKKACATKAEETSTSPPFAAQRMGHPATPLRRQRRIGGGEWQSEPRIVAGHGTPCPYEETTGRYSWFPAVRLSGSSKTQTAAPWSGGSWISGTRPGT